MSLLRGMIASGARNPVFANFLTVCVVAGGVFCATRLVRETFPQFSTDHLLVEAAYPGASPEDVEQAVCTPIEEAVGGVSGVREISSIAYENYGVVWVALRYDVRDPNRILDEVRQRVDQISTFPDEVEKPVVSNFLLRSEVVNVAIYGDVPERTLKRFAQEVRDDLQKDPEISQISLWGVRDDEIIIEVSEESLSAYGLNMTQLMAAVARSSLDLPAGVIRTAGEEVTLRVTGQRLAAADYENLVVSETPEAVVRLSDIAVVREGFAEEPRYGRFNGQPASIVAVFKTPDQDSTKIARVVRDYVAARQAWLPERLRMSVWGDTSADIQSLLMLLREDMIWAVLLCLATLVLFLQFRYAFWIAWGIPVSFCGSLIVMYFCGMTLNIVSLFALIMVSGMFVDDGIVIGESIYTRRQAGDAPEPAAIDGAHRVALDVLGSHITTIIAFMPLLFVVGVMGRFVRAIPVVAIASVVTSAVESFVCLPSHLCPRAVPGRERPDRAPHRLRQVLDAALRHVITRWYRPVYRLALRNPLVTFSLAAAGLLVVVGLVVGGRIHFVVLTKEDASVVCAKVRFPEGTPIAAAQNTVERLERAAWQLNTDAGLKPRATGDLVRQVYSIVGEHEGFIPLRGSSLCEVRVELMPVESRGVDVERIISGWRANIGEVHEAAEFTISRQTFAPADWPIEIRLLGNDLEKLTEASERIQGRLRGFDGVRDVHDDLIPGKRELRVNLRPAAGAIGLTLDDVARHLRHGFYGGEAVRLQRGREQVKVRVRYPAEERRSLADLENERIATSRGDEVPFTEVAEVVWARSYATIGRQDGQRRVCVRADLDERRANAERILQTLESGFIGDVVDDYEGMSYEFAGSRRFLNESLGSLYKGFWLAVIGMYTVLGAMLRSYVQPLVIFLSIPFGVIGVVLGHLVMGYDLTVMSVFGTVALTGVVTNDALILIDVINEGIRNGQSVQEAVFAAGELRFRAVVLTMFSTVAGMLMLLFEQSASIQSVMPMTITLSFGVCSGTLLTLFVVPAVYLVVNDGRRLVHWLRYGGPYPIPELVEEAFRQREAAPLPAG